MDNIRVKSLHDKGNLFIPEGTAILSEYGEKTIAALDSEYDFNKHMGNKYSTGYIHMVFIMLQNDDEILQNFQRLPEGPCRDIFNIIGSTIRTVENKPYKWL